VIRSLDERRSQRARRKAAASASHGRKPKGIRFKGRGCEILAGMKGWRPSAWLKLETGSGSFQADVFLPDVGSIGLSLFPVLGLLGPRRQGSPFSRNEAPRPPGSDGNGARASAIRKRRQPFTCFIRSEEPETKTEGPTMNPGRTRNAYVAAAPQSRNRLKTKKYYGGRRKSLKRLDSAKESVAFNLDFLPGGFGFPSDRAWISFRSGLDFLPGDFGFRSRQ
jgi:hypothetical protein